MEALIELRTADALARLLAPGGVFRFATDWADYASWTLALALNIVLAGLGWRLLASSRGQLAFWLSWSRFLAARAFFSSSSCRASSPTGTRSVPFGKWP